MPRTPTGNPRGRPLGTGKLGAQTRFTVRIPTLLYDRLEAFAAGRHFHRGTPQLAGCVRDALAEYLDRHSKRQTENTTPPVADNIRQIEKRAAPVRGALAEAGDEKRQTRTVPERPTMPRDAQSNRQPRKATGASRQAEAHTRQTKRDTRTVEQSPHATRAPIRQPRNTHVDVVSMREEAEDIKRQTENTVPAYDTTKYVLGEICAHNHAYHGTGHSLRRLADRECLECLRARDRAYRQRKRQAQPA